MNSLLIDALHCRNQNRPPVWLMRQAGRYMPEYMALRKKHSFLEMCHQPELIAEITKQPIHAFGMDAAIIFSDILVLPEALGVGLRFDDGVGPIIERPLFSPQCIKNLPKIDVRESLKYVADGIRLLIPDLKVPLLGFCGAPFTLASYMIEGGSNQGLKKTKQWMLNDPDSFHELLDKLSDYLIPYLEMQIEAGVQAVQVFDSWANVLSNRHFHEFSLAYMEKIVRKIKPKVPVILFCRGSSCFASDLVKAAPSCISVDWNAEIGTLRSIIPKSIAIQGNLDPDFLYAPLDVLKKEVNRLLTSMKGDPGYVFNLGHGITPQTPVEAVRLLVECVQERG